MAEIELTAHLVRRGSRSVDHAMAAELVRRFTQYVATIQRGIQRDRPPVGWVLSRVEIGSLLWTIEPEARSRDESLIAERTSGRALDLIHALEVGEDVTKRYSRSDVAALRELAWVTRDEEYSVTLSSAQSNVTIRSNAFLQTKKLLSETSPFHDYGAVEGDLEAVTLHRGNEFRVYCRDLHDGIRAVVCRFPGDLFERVREAIGHRVSVFGAVSVDNWGQVISVCPRRSDDIRIIDTREALPSIEDLAGSIPDLTGGLPAEEYVRTLRDGRDG